MYPILGRYGPFFFYTYSAVMGLGLLAALGLMAWQERRQLAAAGWQNSLLLALPAGLIGGRLAYVAANWPYFQAHPAERWFVWRGGLSYHGAVLTGLLVLALWAWRNGRSPASYAGRLAPAAALWSTCGWLACWFEGCAYGRETFIGPLSADLPDSYGVFAVRYQTQLLGMALSLATLALLWRLRHLQPASSFWLALFLLSAGRFLVSFFRGDAVPVLAGVRLDTILDGALAGSALAAIGLRRLVARDR